ncbi:hypothetical protein DFJ74DRAFT_669612 [Hyaloraphidium curvatum]|nr:hypothetical protein DFJ74DRAFT_669612 [Hyaloraphidium curvatum]
MPSLHSARPPGARPGPLRTCPASLRAPLSLLLLLLAALAAPALATTCNDYYLYTLLALGPGPAPTVAVAQYPSPPRTGTFSVVARSKLVSQDLLAPPLEVVRRLEMWLDAAAALNSTQRTAVAAACKVSYSPFILTGWNGAGGAAQGVPSGVTVDGDGVAATYCSTGHSLSASWATLASNCNWDTSESNVTHWTYTANVHTEWTDNFYVDGLIEGSHTSSSVTAIRYTFAKDSLDAFVPNSFKVTNFGYSRPTDATTRLTIAYTIKTYYPYKPAVHSSGVTLPAGWAAEAKSQAVDADEALSTQSCDSEQNPVEGVTQCTQAGEFAYTFNTTAQCDPAGTFSLDFDVACYGPHTCNPDMGLLAEGYTDFSVGAGVDLCAAINVVNPLEIIEPFAATSADRRTGEPVVHRMKFSSAKQRMHEVRVWDFWVGQLPSGPSQHGYSYEWSLYASGVRTAQGVRASASFAAPLTNGGLDCSLQLSYYPTVGPNKTDSMIAIPDLGKTLQWQHTVRIRVYYDAVIVDTRRARRLLSRDELVASPGDGEAPEVAVDHGAVVPSIHLGLEGDASFSAAYSLAVPADLPAALFSSSPGGTVVGVENTAAGTLPVATVRGGSDGLGAGAIAGFVMAGVVVAGAVAYLVYRKMGEGEAKAQVERVELRYLGPKKKDAAGAAGKGKGEGRRGSGGGQAAAK